MLENYIYIYIYVGVIGLGVHIYVYIGPGAQSEDMNSPRTCIHLPKNPYW